MIDACCKYNETTADGGTRIKKVLFSSVMDAERYPSFQPKVEIETYLKNATKEPNSFPECYIFRCGGFMDNFSDKQSAPLTRNGNLKGFYSVTERMPLISCHDIGKAVVKMIKNPKEFGTGKPLLGASVYITMPAFAASLSKLTGSDVKYEKMPRWMAWIISKLVLGSPLMWELIKSLDDVKPADDQTNAMLEQAVKTFRAFVPDALDANKYWESLGEYADGTKFGDPAPPGYWDKVRSWFGG